MVGFSAPLLFLRSLPEKAPCIFARYLSHRNERLTDCYRRVQSATPFGLTSSFAYSTTVSVRHDVSGYEESPKCGTVHKSLLSPAHANRTGKSRRRSKSPRSLRPQFVGTMRVSTPSDQCLRTAVGSGLDIKFFWKNLMLPSAILG